VLLGKEKPMIWYILIGIAVVIIAFLAFVAMKPAEFSITRSATMSAPHEAAFAQVNDFHNWAAWSPWEKLDATMEKTFDGAPAGIGAIYSWNGNNKVGEGRMTILESRPNDMIRIKLEFMRPFAATNSTEFTFKPEGNKTLVTWNMSGKHNFMAKGFMLFMNMDKMVGGDFEKGLAEIKGVVEGAGK
jgi:hypothetical protein